MEPRRNALLADLARDASLERSDFLVRAGEQLERFMNENAERIRELGGIVLIDDDPDYLAVAPDGTFRSRTRIYDEGREDWVAETEVIETAGELVELYNPADVLQGFADAAREAEWEPGEGAVEADDGTAAASQMPALDPYAGAADSWAAGQPSVPEATDERSAATALYDLALDFQERSQRSESGLIEQFEAAASSLLGQVGTLVIVDDDDEHLALGVGGFRGRVIPEGESGWQDLSGPDDIVRFYDPTDVFGDLAEAIVEAYPAIDQAEADEADEADGAEADGADVGAEDTVGETDDDDEAVGEGAPPLADAAAESGNGTGNAARG